MKNKSVTNGKGDKPRHKLNDHWRKEYDRIFSRKKPKKNDN